ncbi:MAG: hypothetical protein RMI79_05045 [Nitrososphaerota archaeon]|nr:hypothetical protein [Nitrososphaerota archaeon]
MMGGKLRRAQSSVIDLIGLVKLLVIFIVAYALALLCVLTLVYLNFDIFMRAYAELAPSGYKPRMSDVMRLTVMWTFYSSTLGRPLLPYGDAYLRNPLIILLCYLPAILAFMGLLLSKREVTLYFSVLALASILLTSGFSFIGGGPYLYDSLVSFPLLRAFRSSHNWIFFLIISFSILIGCTVSSLCKRLKSGKSKITAIGLVVTVFLSTTYPLTTGDVARNFLNPEIKGTLLPQSYHELNDILPGEYWSLLLPQRRTYVAYNFSGVPFQVGNPYTLIFSKPIITGVGTEYVRSKSQGLIEEIYGLVQSGVIQEGTSKLLGVLGIKYLVLEKNFMLGDRFSAKALSISLRGSKYVRLVKEWDEVDLFESIYALQKIYVADNLIVYGSVDDICRFIRDMEWDVLKRSAFIDTTSAIKFLNKTLLMPLDFSWRKISPVKYEVTVRSEGPFLLVFLGSYDEKWRVYVNGVQVPETGHVKVNMFANGWLIDATGFLEIVIQYEAQIFFERVVFISLISQFLFLVYLGRRDVILKISHFMRKAVRRV